MFRSALVAGVAAVVVISAGCSSSDGADQLDGPDAVDAVSTSVPTSQSPVSTVPTTDPAPTTIVVPDEPQLVTVGVRIPDRSIDASVSVDAEVGGDPFDDAFATCSAYRSVAGAYAVGAGGPDAELPWVSIVSAERVDGAGDVAADVRVDLPDGGEIDAVGTMTIDADLASGSFSATAADGALVEGQFECAGSERPPITMAATDEGAIEVVALIDRDGRERVVSAATLDAADADCPADPGSVVVRIDGDASLGAISMFEIARTGDDAALRMRVGATDYEFDDIVLDLDAAERVGTFGASGDVAVVGAFSCS